MRRRRGLDVHGVVLLDKPSGISSNRALQKVRGIYQARKAGHTGSLDPFATGMLPVCLGEASKTAAYILEGRKRYRASAEIGVATSTGDIEGEVVQEGPVPDIGAQDVEQVFRQFTGDIEQVPPMYSALKHEGRPLYEYARAGITLERKARKVRIDELVLVAWKAPRLVFEVQCSKGTYIRTLAEDIAAAMNSCGHLVELRRQWAEPFETGTMVTLEQLQVARETGKLQSHLLPVDVGLQTWPRLDLDVAGQQRFLHGNPVPSPDRISAPCMARVYAKGGDLLGLGQVTDTGVLQPARVFNLPRA